MPFRKSVALEVTNTANLLSVLKTQLVNMGWTDHDDQISGSDYFVVYSDGEYDGCPYRVYLQIINDSANLLSFRRWGYWNNSTQTGTFGIYSNSYSRVTVDDDASFFVWIYGNKDSVVLLTLIAGAYDGVAVHRFYPVNNALGRLQSAVTTGVDKTIQLASGEAANFSVGAGVSFWDYQNSSHAGRNHRSLITEVNPSADTITVDEVYVAMQQNAIVGYCIDFHLGIAYPGVTGVNINAETYTTSGTTQAQTGCSLTEIVSQSSLDPDTQNGLVDQGPSNQYVSLPWRVPRASQGILGWFSGVVSKSPYTEQSSYEDTCAIGLLEDEQTATGGTSSTIEASAATGWGVNRYQDKVVITTGGTGSGQIRRITSNDSTSLTVSGDWSVDPDNTTDFVICQAGARHFGMGQDANSIIIQEEPPPPRHPSQGV
jgi:hypothetical protein